MDKDDQGSLHFESGGRRFDLYAEVGKYFSPDGHPDEDTFRTHIRENMSLINAKAKNRDDFENQAGEWLSSLLEKITGYLEEKGLNEEASVLFRAAVEEASLANVRKISVPPERLRMVLTHTQPPAQKVKKGAPQVNRENIFTAALQLFVEKGFHNTTVDEIASLSGVGKGTVYRNFKTKEDLLEQLLAEKINEIVAIFNDVLLKADDILTLAEEALSCWVLFIEKNHLLYRLIQKEEIMYRPGGKAMFYHTILHRLPMLKERIVALNTGSKVKTMNFYTTFYGIMGFIDGVVYKWLQSGMGHSLQEELPVILETLFNGFVGEKAGGKRFFIPPEERSA